MCHLALLQSPPAVLHLLLQPENLRVADEGDLLLLPLCLLLLLHLSGALLPASRNQQMPWQAKSLGTRRLRKTKTKTKTMTFTNLQ